MKNRIEKANKTKFDYVARSLGIFGILIIIATCFIGGITLTSISNENRNLINIIDNSHKEVDKIQNAKNDELVNKEKNIEIIVEE